MYVVYISLDMLIKTKTKMVCTDLTKTTLTHVICISVVLVNYMYNYIKGTVTFNYN